MNASFFSELKLENFEQVVFCNDNKTGLRAIIAIHSRALGPGVGGCRMWNYQNEAEAINDVLRLSKGMSYKASVAGLNWGGAKAIIWGDPKKDKTPELLKRYGEYVDRLGGHYVTAKDVGIGSEDLRTIKSKTKHVLGIDGDANSSGDPSPATAWGVYHGMKAATEARLGTASLKNLTVALQGLGSVSYYLIEHLVAEGAKVVGCDIDQAVIDRAVKKYGITTVAPDAIYDVKCDVFSPSALGASINPQTISRISAPVIAGAANNQLSNTEIGFELQKRNVLYAPDYVINAGGLINIYHEGAVAGGYNKQAAFDHVQKIGSTMKDIFKRSSDSKTPTHVVADQIAQERIDRASQK